MASTPNANIRSHRAGSTNFWSFPVEILGKVCTAIGEIGLEGGI